MIRNARYFNGFIHFPQLTHGINRRLWNVRMQCSRFFLGIDLSIPTFIAHGLNREL